MNKSKGMAKGVAPRGGEGCGGGEALDIERLRRRFAKFRRGHERGTRIPDELRAAAVAALDRGASERDVRRACQATSVQLARWRRKLRRHVEGSSAAKETTRVFPVVEGPTARGMGLGSEGRALDLELRLGGISVRICQLDG